MTKKGWPRAGTIRDMELSPLAVSILDYLGQQEGAEHLEVGGAETRAAIQHAME